MLRQIQYAVIVAGAVLIAALVYVDLPGTPAESGGEETTAPSTIALGGHVVRVTIVETAEERAQGLSGRSALAEDEGMLFVFPEDGRYSFWMKDMQFSIDIVWISASSTIVDIAANVSPDTYPTAFSPEEAARYVLELPAGWADTHGVNVGDTVEI